MVEPAPGGTTAVICRPSGAVKSSESPADVPGGTATCTRTGGGCGGAARGGAATWAEDQKACPEPQSRVHSASSAGVQRVSASATTWKRERRERRYADRFAFLPKPAALWKIQLTSSAELPVAVPLSGHPSPGYPNVLSKAKPRRERNRRPSDRLHATAPRWSLRRASMHRRAARTRPKRYVDAEQVRVHGRLGRAEMCTKPTPRTRQRDQFGYVYVAQQTLPEKESTRCRERSGALERLHSATRARHATHFSSWWLCSASGQPRSAHSASDRASAHNSGVQPSLQDRAQPQTQTVLFNQWKGASAKNACSSRAITHQTLNP